MFSDGIGAPFLPLAALIAAIIIPSDGHTDIVGRYGGEFMATGGGARAVALGGAYTAVAGDAWALFWNPSGLVRVERSEVGLMHSERFAGVVDYSSAVYAAPRPDGSVWSAGLIRLGVNGIPFTRLEGPGPLSNQNRVEVDRYVNSGDYVLFVGKAERFGRWRWGVAPKLIFKHIGDSHRAYGLGVDVGAGGRPVKWLPIEAGIAVRDLLGTVLAWEQTGRKEIIPSTLRTGLAALIDLPPLEARLTAAADLSYRFEVFGGSDAAALHLGAEYLVRQTVALRVGSDDGGLTIGGGLELLPVGIDYAYIEHDDLGDTHRVSINARWGK